MLLSISGGLAEGAFCSLFEPSNWLVRVLFEDEAEKFAIGEGSPPRYITAKARALDAFLTADVEGIADVRMIETGNGASLAHTATASRAIKSLRFGSTLCSFVGSGTRNRQMRKTAPIRAVGCIIVESQAAKAETFG